jgi:hypothetical protein
MSSNFEAREDGQGRALWTGQFADFKNTVRAHVSVLLFTPHTPKGIHGRSKRAGRVSAVRFAGVAHRSIPLLPTTGVPLKRFAQGLAAAATRKSPHSRGCLPKWITCRSERA